MCYRYSILVIQAHGWDCGADDDNWDCTPAVLFFTKGFGDSNWFHFLCMAISPIGFLAILARWFVTAVAHQPWMINGVLRTMDSLSPMVIGGAH